ncbi:hypothetical protein [Nocardia paucivorans]|uniref:hypothetical protein n=1 Tax=Nocardia paucivorans TaxID=114259 RepID=UPI0002DA8830|nr:hypothetical protein [Nocardia paucivorans]
MSERRALLVGTLPGDTAEDAMRAAVERLGASLRYLPDGETGDRRDWVAGLITSFADHTDLEIARPGNWSNYKDQQNYRVRKGHHLRGENLDLKYLSWYRTNRKVFDRLKSERPELSDVDFQVGIPGDLDLTMFTMGPTRMFGHRAAFAEATLRDITAIREEGGDDVLFQLELPVETVFVAKSGPLGGFVANRMAAGVHRLVAATPAGTRFGVHLCLGDLGHKALTGIGSARPLVRLANALAAAWPEGRTLEYVHAPFAAGDEPPQSEPAFYRALSGLRLPEQTRFVAGFLHESSTLDEQRRLLDTIETAVGRQVDVAAACGLGRRTPADAYKTMDQARTLCEQD